MFGYSPEVIARFPSIRGGVIHATGLSNGPSPDALRTEYADEQAKVVARVGDRALAEIPSIHAWRRAFTNFGVKPTQYRSAAEALLRRLTKKGDIPSINLLVDVGNLVAIRHALPVAVFDRADVTGATSVRFAEGGERFTDLGSDAVVHPEPGEVVFVDAAGLVSARRWCWRQSSQSAANVETTEALITVEGHHAAAEADVTVAVADLVDLLRRYQPEAHTVPSILSPDRPHVD